MRGCKEINRRLQVSNIIRPTLALPLPLPLPLPLSPALLHSFRFCRHIIPFFDHAHICCNKQYRHDHFKGIQVMSKRRQNSKKYESHFESRRSTLVYGSQCGANQSLINGSQRKSTEVNESRREAAEEASCCESVEVNVSQREFSAVNPVKWGTERIFPPPPFFPAF